MVRLGGEPNRPVNYNAWRPCSSWTSRQRRQPPPDLVEVATHYPTWDELVTAAVPPSLPGTPQPEEDPTLWCPPPVAIGITGDAAGRPSACPGELSLRDRGRPSNALHSSSSGPVSGTLSQDIPSVLGNAASQLDELHLRNPRLNCWEGTQGATVSMTSVAGRHRLLQARPRWGRKAAVVFLRGLHNLNEPAQLPGLDDLKSPHSPQGDVQSIERHRIRSQGSQCLLATRGERGECRHFGNGKQPVPSGI